MTQEQERPKKSPIQFPRVSKERLDRLIEEYWSPSENATDKEVAQKLVALSELIKKREYALAGFISWASEEFQVPFNFQVGGGFVYLAIDGNKLAPVSEAIVEGLIEEIDSAKRREGEFSEAVDAPLRLLDPYLYAEENPSLMVWIGSRKHGVKEGGISVYELKRRQFFADQLAKQLGG